MPKINNEITVKIFDDIVGYLVEDKGMIYFEYDDIFKTKNIEISPLKLNTKEIALYTNTDDRYFNTLAGVFSDSLPDKFGNAIIDKYYEDKGMHKEGLNIIQRLAYIGLNSMGALEYIPSVQTDEIKEALEIKHLVNEARAILSGDIKTTLPEIMEAGGSAGGARAKAIIQWDKTINNIISGRAKSKQGYEQYLIKFDGVGQHNKREDYTKIEYIYMKIASICGLNVAEVDMIHDRDYSHLLVKRFDRVANKKLHMHSLCGMTHTDFNISGLYSYEEYLQTIKLVVNNQKSVVDAYSHMIFNIISSNQDDHTKNFSFLMSEAGEWNISPIYDLTYSHGSGYTSRHQLTLNGKQENFELEDLLKIADGADIKRSDAKLIINHIQTIFYENFEKMANDLDVDKNRIKRILGNCRRF